MSQQTPGQKMRAFYEAQKHRRLAWVRISPRPKPSHEEIRRRAESFRAWANSNDEIMERWRAQQAASNQWRSMTAEEQNRLFGKRNNGAVYISPPILGDVDTQEKFRRENMRNGWFEKLVDDLNARQKALDVARDKAAQKSHFWNQILVVALIFFWLSVVISWCVAMLNIGGFI